MNEQALTALRGRFEEIEVQFKTRIEIVQAENDRDAAELKKKHEVQVNDLKRKHEREEEELNGKLSHEKKVASQRANEKLSKVQFEFVNLKTPSEVSPKKDLSPT